MNLVIPEQQEGETAYTRPRRLGGFIGVASRLPLAGGPGRSLAEVRALLDYRIGRPGATPARWRIRRFTYRLALTTRWFPAALSRAMRDKLVAFGASNIAFKEYADGGHTGNGCRA